MRRYCFLPCTPAVDGEECRPECPEEIESLCLACAGGLGLFEVETSPAWTPASRVGDDLARRIESAKRYPPALALARQEMLDVFGGLRPEPSQLARAYGTALDVHLARQHDSSYVVAKALRSEAGLTEGEWYWVLSISGHRISWVSADYVVRKTPMHDFDLTGRQLKRLGYAG